MPAPRRILLRRMIMKLCPYKIKGGCITSVSFVQDFYLNSSSQYLFSKVIIYYICLKVFTEIKKPGSFLVILCLLILINRSSEGQPVLTHGGDPSGGAPYVFTDPANPNNYIGYELEIADAVAKQMGMRAELIRTDWEAIVASLKNKKFDVIFDGFEPTADRAREIIFSKPYYLFRLQLTVRKDNKEINSLEDCRRLNKSVGTLVNCAASRLLENEKYNWRPYADPVGAYKDLEYGRIDAVLMDIPMEMFYARSNPEFRKAGEPFHKGAYVVGIRKEDTLLQKRINSAIDTLLRDGTFEKIFRKWDMWDDFQLQLAGKTDVHYEITEKKFDWIEALLKLAHAAGITILLAFGAMLIAVVLGIPLAVGQMYGPKTVRIFCNVYIEFFRGTPVLVQLLFLYFGLPVIGISLPGWLTALVGLGLNYAAYESQVYRAAFQAVPSRQWDVSYSLGMKPMLAFRRIILPQAVRTALPPMTNDFVALFKDTSTAFAISVWELATAYRELANATQSYLLLGAVVCVFYLAMSLPLTHYARKLENKLKRSSQKLEKAPGT